MLLILKKVEWFSKQKTKSFFYENVEQWSEFLKWEKIPFLTDEEVLQIVAKLYG